MNTWIAGKDSMKHFTPKESFYSKLNLEGIINENHNHAKKYGIHLT